MALCWAILDWSCLHFTGISIATVPSTGSARFSRRKKSITLRAISSSCSTVGPLTTFTGYTVTENLPSRAWNVCRASFEMYAEHPIMVINNEKYKHIEHRIVVLKVIISVLLSLKLNTAKRAPDPLAINSASLASAPSRCQPIGHICPGLKWSHSSPFVGQVTFGIYFSGSLPCRFPSNPRSTT